MARMPARSQRTAEFLPSAIEFAGDPQGHVHRLFDNSRTRLNQKPQQNRVISGKCKVTKGVRWMPWRLQTMKDVVSCDKLREAAHERLIRRCPNGETRRSNPPSRPAESIGGCEATGGSDTSQYPEEEKSTEIPSVAASERGTAQTGGMSSLSALCHRGCRAEMGGAADPPSGRTAKRNGLERPTKEGDSPVSVSCSFGRSSFLSKAGHEKPRLNPGGPPSKAKYSQTTDSEPVP